MVFEAMKLGGPVGKVNESLGGKRKKEITLGHITAPMASLASNCRIHVWENSGEARC